MELVKFCMPSYKLVRRQFTDLPGSPSVSGVRRPRDPGTAACTVLGKAIPEGCPAEESSAAVSYGKEVRAGKRATAVLTTVPHHTAIPSILR